MPEASVAVRRCHTFEESCNAASTLPMCLGCLKNTFINRLEKHTYMSKFIGLAPVCDNGLQMSASQICDCSDIGCNGDALWYVAQMHGFCTECCGVRTLLQHVGCICGSAVLCNVDTAVVRSVSNNASTTFCDCITGDAASVHHRACRLRCKRFAPCVAMLSSSAASAKQYGRRSFALLILCDADMRDTDVCRNLRSDDGRVSHDALTAVGGEISEDVRTCYNEYLQYADATASGDISSSVGIAHTPGGKCADTLSFPNFKAAASQEIHRTFLVNTNRANFSNGNVGSRLGATEWTGSLARFFRTSRNGERNSPAAPHICPNSASSEAGQIMPQIPHRPSENARKSLAGSGERSSKMTANRVGADTPIETRCSHKGLPSDTVFFR